MRSRRGPRPARWRPGLLTWVAAGCALIGIGLLTYTPAASWLHQYEQSRLIDAYNRQALAEQEASADRVETPDAALSEAASYNEKLSFGAIVEANTHVPTGVGDEVGSEYWDLLNGPAEIMSRIRVPSIDVDLPVYHGTSDVALLRGAGHLRGTSLPVGGPSTHAVITAHRGLAEATMFTNLDRVQVGDRFTLETFGEVLVYEVRATQVVAPEESQSLRAQEGRDLVTLVTCTPLGINSHRILVLGERVLPTPEQDVAAALRSSELPRFPWWAVLSTTALLCTVGFVWRAGFRDAGRDHGRSLDSAG
ncbi:class C sortase [Arachnia propionica]|uniref:Class C sortase n=1 Tax=Arachnia propionica TaxID=1750 RepID=A0A3P1TE50_9ACTN|nr:class C sortase [Arachnia propionica]MDO5081978.1 class C sortase [Arachnia propionica]RRD07176.1 class C sortase [Arachnia propionica]